MVLGQIHSVQNGTESTLHANEQLVVVLAALFFELEALKHVRHDDVQWHQFGAQHEGTTLS